MAEHPAPWDWPYGNRHRTVATVDDLILAAGVVATDAAGAVPEPGDLESQAARAIHNLEASLAEVGAGLDAVVKVKAYYQTDGSVDEAALLARLRGRFDADLGPVLTAIPVRHLAYPGMALQLHCIGQREWRRADNLKAVQGRFAIGRPEGLGPHPYTDAIRAEDMMYFAAQAALDEAGRVISPGEGVPQTRVLMDRLGNLLADLGATFQDAVKKEGYYIGRDMAEWAEMARGARLLLPRPRRRGDGGAGEPLPPAGPPEQGRGSGHALQARQVHPAPGQLAGDQLGLGPSPSPTARASGSGARSSSAARCRSSPAA